MSSSSNTSPKLLKKSASIFFSWLGPGPSPSSPSKLSISCTRGRTQGQSQHTATRCCVPCAAAEGWESLATFLQCRRRWSYRQADENFLHGLDMWTTRILLDVTSAVCRPGLSATRHPRKRTVNTPLKTSSSCTGLLDRCCARSRCLHCKQDLSASSYARHRPSARHCGCTCCARRQGLACGQG